MQFVLLTILLCSVVFCASWLCLLPFKNTIHISKIVYYLSNFVYCICIAIIMSRVDMTDYAVSSGTMKFACFSLVAFMLVLGIFAMRENAGQFAFVLLVVMSVYDVAQILARMITAHLVAIWGKEYYMLLFACSIVLVLVPATFALYLVDIHLLIPVTETTIGKNMWSYQWIVPLFFDVVFRLRIFPNFDSNVENGPFDVFVLAVWIIFGCTIYIVLLFSMLRNAKAVALEQQLAATKLQTEMQRSQYELLQRSIERTRRTAHDLRHHFIVLDSLAEEGDCDGIRKYLNANRTNFGEQDMPPVCDNYSVNSVLCHHISEARKYGADVKTNMQIPRNLGDDESDVSIIISNLVENAVEACERIPKGDRFIEINASPVGNGKMLAVTVKNSYSGEIQQRNGRFVSSKENKRMGIGTESVRNMVEMRGGICNYKYGNGIFIASVLIKLSDEQSGVKV